MPSLPACADHLPQGHRWRGRRASLSPSVASARATRPTRADPDCRTQASSALAPKIGPLGLVSRHTPYTTILRPRLDRAARRRRGWAAAAAAGLCPAAQGGRRWAVRGSALAEGCWSLGVRERCGMASRNGESAARTGRRRTPLRTALALPVPPADPSVLLLHARSRPRRSARTSPRPPATGRVSASRSSSRSRTARLPSRSSRRRRRSSSVRSRVRRRAPSLYPTGPPRGGPGPGCVGDTVLTLPLLPPRRASP